MTNDKLRQTWGAGALSPKVPGTLADLAMSNDTRALLLEVGTPTECPLFVSFSRTLDRRSLDGLTYIILGDDGGTQLCIIEGKDEVWSVDPSKRLPSRFINSSLRCFLTCLALYRDDERSLESATDEEAATLVSEFRLQISAIDSAALSHPENWWSVILEQLE